MTEAAPAENGRHGLNLDVSLLPRAEREFFALMRPPPKLDLATWIEGNIRLPAGQSALPGPVRLWPHQIGVCVAISDPLIERVTVQKAARIGYTLLLGGVIGSYIDNEPAPVLVILPTESDARNFMVDQLEPTFEASPPLRGKLTGDQDEAGRNTLLHRRFAGGSLKIVASKAPRNLRAHTAQVVIFDEIDAMIVSDEGDPIALGIMRSATFANRKIIMGSTPVYSETSHVIRSYEESDQRVFEIPCVHCGAFFELLWQHVRWEENRPETAHVVCPHCEGRIEESAKADMVANGVWRITRPDVKGHAGFRINALISMIPAASWPKLAAELLKAKKSPDTLQAFVNTVLGQGWDSRGGEALDEGELQSRAEEFGLKAIPTGVRVITCGVDIQRDRAELVFLGFTDSQTLILGHDVIYGDPTGETLWAELDDALKTRWPHPLGGTIGIDACAVDSGDGATTDHVNAFTRPRFNRRVVSIKGVAGVSRPAIEASKTRGSKLFLVGVDGLKRKLANAISHGASWRFSHDLSADFYEQLCSERLSLKYVRGQPVRIWERIPGRRAEALDSTVYALAVRNLVHVDFNTRENTLRGLSAPRTPTVIRSKWMTQGRD